MNHDEAVRWPQRWPPLTPGRSYQLSIDLVSGERQGIERGSESLHIIHQER